MVVLGREAARHLVSERAPVARANVPQVPRGLSALLEMNNPGTFGARHKMKRVLVDVLSGNLPDGELNSLSRRTDRRESLGAMGVAAAELMKSGGLTGVNAAKLVGKVLPSVGDGGHKQLTTTLIAVASNRDVSFSIVSDAVKLLGRLYAKADAQTQESMKRVVRNAEFEGRVFKKAVDEFNNAVKAAPKDKVVCDVLPEPAML